MAKSLLGKNDYLSSRHKCSQSSEIDRVNDEMKKDPETSGMLLNEYNIAWMAIQQDPFLSKDKELSELFMTLMGTFIVRNEGDKPDSNTIPSKVTDEDFLQALLKGGTINLLSCDNSTDQRCLRPQEKRQELSEASSWGGKVRLQLVDIQQKILGDIELNDEEISLLAKSHLPIFKILNVLTAYTNGICPVDLFRVADVIAADLLNQFLRESIEIVRAGCEMLRQEQYFAKEIDQYISTLDRTAAIVRHNELRVSNRFQEEYQLIQKVQQLEKQIAAELFCN